MKRIATFCAVILVGGCSTIGMQEQPAARRLAAVAVPEIDLRNAAISDVVKFIACSWHCLGHPIVYPTQDIEGDSVTYRFYVDAYDPHDPNSSITLVKGTNETTLVRLGPMITLHAEEISALDLVTRVAEEANGLLEIHGDEVIIKTKKVEPSSPPYSEKAADAPF